MKTMNFMGVTCVAIALAIGPALARKGKSHGHQVAASHSDHRSVTPRYINGTDRAGGVYSDPAQVNFSRNYDDGYSYYARGHR